MAVLEHPDRLPRASEHVEVAAPGAGTFVGVRARPAGDWITGAGGGRVRPGDAIDPRVGVELLLPPGAMVRKGDPVMRLHMPQGGCRAGAAERSSEWLDIVDEPLTRRSWILEVVDRPGQ